MSRRTLPDAPKLTAEMENEARTVLGGCFPAQWSSHMLEAWVGEVDKLRGENELLREVAKAARRYLTAEFRPVLPEHKKIGDDRDKAIEVVHRGMDLRTALAAVRMKVGE